VPSDPYQDDRDRVRAAIERAERSLFARAVDLLREWATRLRSAVFGPGGRVDPRGVFETEPWFRTAVDDVVVEIQDVYEDAADDVQGDDDPNGYRLAREFIVASRNRLVRVPDSVYSQVTRAVFAGDRDGDSTDELAERIEAILAASGADTWTNRATTIARTEATAAYNAGTFDGFLGLAAQLGGKWEKGWLAVEDARTRPSHVEADLQRRPLLLPFSVGGWPGMYPGAIELPAGEVVNCRCSMVLLRPGEQMDYSNRQYKGA